MLVKSTRQNPIYLGKHLSRS